MLASRNCLGFAILETTISHTLIPSRQVQMKGQKAGASDGYN